MALGGNGGAGGNGLGGGLFADPDTTAAISNSSLDLNQAIDGAGFDGGDGSGGGIYYPGTEEAHTNPTRQRGECLRALAGASG